MLVISLGLILTSAEAAHATSFSWNVASGDWFTPGNWNPSGPPGAGDDAVISNGGTATLDASASITNFTLSSGTLAGTGSLDVSGAMSWSGGRLTVGVTNANGGLSMSGAPDKELYAGTLNVNSSATWTGAGNFVYGIGTGLSIAATTTFDIQTDADFSGNGGAAFITINNAGTFQKSAGAGTTEVGFALTFNNTGAVDVQTGTLVLRGNGTSSGSFDSTGATLIFNPSVGSETITLTAAASITGGTVTFSGVNGTTVNHAGSYVVGTTNVTSGVVNLTGPGATLGTTVLSGAGTLNVSTSTASTASSLSLGGNRGGSGTLDVSGAMTWNSGRLSGGITNANGGLSLSGALDKELFGGTLNVNSLATWTGTGNIVFAPGPVLSVAAAGTFDIQTDVSFVGNGGAAYMVISNAGTFQKSAGAGATEVGNGLYLAFYNTGTVQALSGTLSFSGGNAPYDQGAGVTRLNGGAITKSGATMSIEGGTLEGFGTLTGNVNNSGGTLSPGLSPGQLNETGAYTQGTGGAFTVEIGGLTVGTQYDRAAISGAAALNGTLNITLINGYEPNIGDTFTVMTFGSRSGDFTTVNGTSIPNGKIFQKNVSGTSVILEVVAAPTTTTTTTTSTTSTTSSTTTTTTSTTTSTTTTTLGGVGHLECYKVRDSRAKVGYTLDLIAGVGGFPNELGCKLQSRAGSICVEVDKQNVSPPPPGGGPPIPPNASSVFLSYKIKCPKQTVAPATLGDQFGAGAFTVGTASALLVPALPGPANDHFKCYKAKDTRPKASYAMDLIAGVGGFANEIGCTVKLGARQICVQVTKQNVIPPPPGGGPGPGPTSGTKFISYNLKCPKGTVPPGGFTDQFGAGTFTPGTGKTLLVPAQ